MSRIQGTATHGWGASQAVCLGQEASWPVGPVSEGGRGGQRRAGGRGRWAFGPWQVGRCFLSAAAGLEMCGVGGAARGLLPRARI